MTNYIRNVAIFGATGHVGSYFVKELLKTGKHNITAITRNESSATFPEEVKVARADYASEQSLVNALRGNDLAVITLASTTKPETHEFIVNAAAKAGINWIVPNVYGSDPENDRLNNDWAFGPTTINNIQHVVKSGANYIVLTGGYWYSWSLGGGEMCYGIDIKEKKAVFFDDGKAKLNTSTFSLFGKALAALLSLPIKKEADGNPAIEDWKNKAVYFSSFLVSQRDMLDSVHRAMGTTDKDWTIEYQNSEERVKQGWETLRQGDRRGWVRAMYTRTFYPNGDGDYQSVKGVQNELLGLPEENLDAVTKEVVDQALA
ncbi:NAD(P)-binding protein [Periconia macrospinosa]|uniref:NAD(P)-binding protein n=1 Tax=Periconia macrospinosa TaxID=97972 RepID=A0A2V1DSK3_9PLEO|nr:NAD(P)-binding protein [Periconia macrospinosa]